MGELDLSKLLADMSRVMVALREHEAERRASAGAGPATTPLEARRWVSTRATYEALQARRGDPAAPYLVAWSFALIRARVCTEAELLAITRRAQTRAPCLAVSEREMTARELVLATMTSPSPGQRAAALASLSQIGETVGAGAAALWARRGEAGQRLGLADREAPLTIVDGGVASMARDTLARTRDLFASVAPRGSVAEVLSRALGASLDVPWPRRLSERFVIDPFAGESRFLDVPELSLGPLPALLGASSVARAFARLGARWADASASRELPRPLAHHPAGLARSTIGALFASLLLEPTFLRRALGFTSAEANRARRGLAFTYLVALRLAAARSLIRPHALEGASRDVVAAFVEHVGDALGAEPAPSLALVVPRLHVQDNARFVAFAEAATLAARLRERHDEDWFRNHRAVLDLRDMLGRAPALRVADDAARQGLSLAERALAEALS